MRILLVDDHPVIHITLGAVARKVFDGATVFTASDLEDALEQARGAERLDLVLLDLGLPGCSGIDALTRFRTACPQPRVVVFSAIEDRGSILRALEAGAAGYIPKTHTSPVISAALRLVGEGGVYVPPQALEPAEGDATQRLTERQLEVLRFMARGLPNKEIAQQLRIACDTVKQHAKAIYSTLGIETRRDAASAAERRGIKLD